MLLDHIYCSDMARAYQTAEPLHALRPNVPFDAMPDLREVGKFDQPDYPADITDDEREQLHQQRITRFTQCLRRDHAVGEVVLIVAHGAMNLRLLESLAGQATPGHFQFAQHHTALTVAGIDDTGRVTIRMANCTRHLPLDQLTGDELAW